MTRLFAILPLIALTACVEPPAEVGRALYTDACASCHGVDGRGVGDAPLTLGKPVPDLTTLTTRNNGVFPQVYVMGVIDGYWRSDDPHSVMPEFGAELQAGDLVGVDTGDGRLTPTPVRLVALAAYLEGLQN
ncbi:c-type cytochrome [Oceaniglobus ichthyenteri]|uniref:c-type cytochrome n=1 Tax=Oceaniglobus ichthyenteri TaxID=2136177 RepID=UPI000D3B56F8|nr:cytochrome c [Oceaniglobus ichthyenteri]